tara:strand:- start:3866 stop:5104 length:1239 start_codon:yes stop_codon:yes gene_type:complete
MNYNKQTADKIDEHIKNNDVTLDENDPCLKETHVELTQDDETRKTIKFDVIKLPLHLVFPNVRNGRFRDIYLEEKMRLQSEGYNGLDESDDPESWELDPFDDTQAKIIREMLLERLEPEASRKLMTAISTDGQKFPGIITHDGRVMNANRRYAVLHRLASSEEPGFIRVVRLPKDTSDKDLHRIEIKEQMGPDFKLDYSPINEVLKVQEVSDLGMTVLEIADEMAKSEEHIEHLQKMYKVALDVLADNGTPNQWPLLKDKFSYLDDLMKQILSDRKKTIWGLTDFLKIKNAAYKLFWEDDFSHKDFRKIPKIMKQDRIKKNFLESVEPNDQTGEQADIKEAFDRAENAEKTAQNSLKPQKILISIKDNFDALLEVLDNNALLKKQQSLDLMDEIITHSEKLKEFRDANKENS